MKLVIASIYFLLSLASQAQTQVIAPGVQLTMSGAGAETGTAVQLIILLTVLSLAPAILIMMTSFTRVVVVISFLRHALGTQTLPPNQVVIGLSMFLTFFVMAPIFTEINNTALSPYLNKSMSGDVAFKNSEKIFRQFMFAQVEEKDLANFMSLARLNKPNTRADVPTWILIPSFMISELKKAFQIGFMIYIPFLIIDMVIASVLMAMGMMMLPPVMISLPFKLLLFVLVDGWQLLVGSLVKSFSV